jgi:ketosteroid isomerase-like protein
VSGTDIEVTSRAWAALQQRDLEGFLDLIDPEIEFISLVAEAEGATYRGHAGVRDWWATGRRIARGVALHVQGFTSLGGGHMLTSVVITGTVAEVEVPQTMWHLVEIREGKAVWWSVFRSEREARGASGAKRADG